jgi:hypothetical protein
MNLFQREQSLHLNYLYKKRYHGMKAKKTEEKLPGYPLYESKDDIYNKATEAKNINPEEVSKLKSANEMAEQERRNEKDFKDDKSGEDLDVSGAELDDEMEDVGSEDEENNYYSLGGDNHENLEEDKGI